jgi:hypothetical protein
MNAEKLVKRVELFIDYVINDDAFKKSYSQFACNIQREGYSYIALHVALTGKNKTTALQYFLKTIRSDWKFIFSKRFLVCIKYMI